MPLTVEEGKKMWEYISKGKHYILDDVVEYMKPLNIHKVINNLPKMRWFIDIEYCQYCHKRMIITRNFTERKFCCKEHRILYHNEERTCKEFTCEYCGEKFYKCTFRKARFCSRECAGYAREAAKRVKRAKLNSNISLD